MKAAMKLIKSSDFFGELKFSERLNVLKTYGDISMTLFSNGDVMLRPIKDEDEAYFLLKRIGFILAPARICPDVDLAVMDCKKMDCKKNCWKPLRLEGELVDAD
jgi:ArsR family metal-binding transcriptional regulator